MLFQMLPVFLTVVAFVGIDGRIFGNAFQQRGQMVAGNSYRTAGSFTADVDDVDFDAETIAGKINSGDNRYMDEQAFTAGISGSSFNGK